MRKEDIASLVVYFLMILISIIVGLTAVQNALSTASMEKPFLTVFLILVVELIFNMIMLEVFHVIGAKIGGYSVVLFNVAYFCFEKRNGKWNFHFKEFDGLTGETKIAPNKEKLNLKPYVWMPLFGYAAEIAISIVVYSMVSNAPASKNVDWLKVAAILMMLISSLLALYNLVPIKLDSMTDGYRMVLLTKQVNIDAYNDLLRAENQEREGLLVDELKVYEEITEFTAGVNVVSIYQCLKNGNYSKAGEIADIILANPKHVEPVQINRVLAQKVYIDIMSKSVEEAKATYEEKTNDEIRRFFANDVSMETIRAYVLIAGMLDESESEVRYSLSKVEKAKKNTLPSRIELENKLLEEAVNKVYEAHKDWKKEA